jgi:hypothetical protein
VRLVDPGSNDVVKVRVGAIMRKFGGVDTESGVRERRTNKLSWEVESTGAEFSKLLRSNDESSERANSTYLYECVNLRLTFEIVL